MLSVAPGFMYALKNRCRLQNDSLCLGEGPEQGRQKLSKCPQKEDLVVLAAVMPSKAYSPSGLVSWKKSGI